MIVAPQTPKSSFEQVYGRVCEPEKAAIDPLKLLATKNNSDSVHHAELAQVIVVPAQKPARKVLKPRHVAKLANQLDNLGTRPFLLRSLYRKKSKVLASRSLSA